MYGHGKLSGKQCQAPAVGGKRVCRMHRARIRAPCGSAHGRYAHRRDTQAGEASRERGSRSHPGSTASRGAGLKTIAMVRLLRIHTRSAKLRALLGFGQPMRKALFLHTPKTAGTSIQEMAREVYGDQNVASHDDYLKLQIAGCKNLPFVSGHFGFEFARPLLADRYCFTFLREPIARVFLCTTFARRKPRTIGQFMPLPVKIASTNFCS